MERTLQSTVSAPEHKGSTANTNDNPIGKAPNKSPEGFGGSGKAAGVMSSPIVGKMPNSKPDGFGGGLINGKC